MKVVKILVVAVLIIVAAYLIAGFLGPKNFSVTRSTTINAPVEVVWDQVYYFSNFNNWSPWYEMDTTQKHIVEGEDGEVGSIMKWSSDNKDVGSGSQERIENVEHSKIVNILRFEGFEMPATDTWTFNENEDGSTEVIWNLSGDLDFMGGVFFLFMNADKAMGPDFERGLEKLKNYTENLKPEMKESPIETKMMEPRPVITIKEATTYDQIPATLGKLYGELMVFAHEKGVEVDGMPFAVYHDWNPPTVTVEAGFFTKELAKETDRVNAYNTEETEVVYTTHWGAYDKAEVTHQRIDEWVVENNREEAGPPMEVYVTDPGMEPDTTKWQTEIYYPLKPAE